MSEPLATQVVCGNLLSALPAPAGGEAFENLFEAAGLRIERIVSHEHASPEGFWYEQPQDEWVMVASGEAILEFGDGSRRTLRAGDWLVLPAGLRHRVAATFERTVWLTVHHFRNTG